MPKLGVQLHKTKEFHLQHLLRADTGLGVIDTAEDFLQKEQVVSSVSLNKE